MHGCKGCGAILPLAILIVTIWPDLIGVKISFWVVVVAAALLLVHSVGCKSCNDASCDSPKSKAKKKKK